MNIKRKININHKEITVEAQPTARLIDVLREDMRLTGTKEGCGEGECGACSVMINGDVVNSCIILWGQMQDGDELITVEGLAKDGKLSPVQDKFIEHGAVHCGACIPGMLVAATAMINKNPNPTLNEIKDGISGNLCRCTGYGKILKAIQESLS
ncbi:MAG: (2Fe-2S)-binding protein [bacterium]|nr:(2Fe-2S)-binding protein [bacterium]MBU1918450.1 (2Fe-2S)-binding protein [bacterium]